MTELRDYIDIDSANNDKYIYWDGGFREECDVMEPYS